MYTQILIHRVYMYSRSGRTNARLATSGDQKPIEKPPIYRHKAINFNINTLHITLHRRCFIKQDIVSSKNSAETNTINQYSNIRECYSIRIRIFVDVIDNVLSIYDSLYY